MFHKGKESQSKRGSMMILSLGMIGILDIELYFHGNFHRKAEMD